MYKGPLRGPCIGLYIPTHLRFGGIQQLFYQPTPSIITEKMGVTQHTLSRDKERKTVAVVHIDNARASSAAAKRALTYNQILQLGK